MSESILIVDWLEAFAFLVFASVAVAGYTFFLSEVFRLRRKPSIWALGLGLLLSALTLVGVFVRGYSLVTQGAVYFIGFVFLFVHRASAIAAFRSAKQEVRGWRWRTEFWFILPVLYYVTRFFASGVPQQHSDPLYYHLSAPKLWVELGRIKLVAEHPSYAQAQIWEPILGLPMFFLGTVGVHAHVVAQIFGQWMHVLWGQILCAAVAFELLMLMLARVGTEVGTRSRGLVFFLAWLSTTQPAFEWMGCLAKNDYLMLVFALALAVMLLQSRFYIAGLFAGFAYSVKVLAAWAVLSSALLLPFAATAWVTFALGALIGVAPFLIRNYIWTHNLLFPNLDAVIGPHWLSTGYINHLLSYGGKFELNSEMLPWIVTQLFQKTEPKAVLVLAFLSGIYLFAQRGRFALKTKSSIFRWGLFVGVQLLFVLVMLRPISDGRYGNIVAIFILLSASVLIYSVRQRIKSKAVFLFSVLIFSIGFFINIPVDILYKIPRQFLFESEQKYVEAFHPIYDVQSWIHKNTAKNSRILFLAEKQHFYLDREFEAVVEMKKWENVLLSLHTADALFEKARSIGYDYIHFSPQAGGFPIQIRPYWSQIEARAGEAVFKSSHSLLFKL